MTPFKDVAGERVAVVTGAAGILGPEICRVLRERGWRVAAADRDERDFELAQKAEQKGDYFDFRWTGDLASRSACQELIQQAERALGPISLLVNNAAMGHRAGHLRELDESQALQLFQVNVLAPLWLVAAAENSLRSHRGTVINLSSIQTRGWLPENHLYVASKAALEKLTETLSTSLEEARVVGMRLGSFPGSHFLRDFLRQLPDEAARRMVEEILPMHYKRLENALGPGKMGRAREVAETVAFLASEEARMFNGCVLDFDGGFTRQPLAWPSVDSRADAERWFERWAKSSDGENSSYRSKTVLSQAKMVSP